MNISISGILNSTYSNNVTSTKQSQNVDTISSATKTQSIQPDAISSATKTNGGDHYFEARV